MQIRNIEKPVLNAAVSILGAYVPDLSATALVEAIQNYKAADIESKPLEKPMTRSQAAELLGVSLNTINRYLNNGRLKRIKITDRSVRITAASVRALLNGEVE